MEFARDFKWQLEAPACILVSGGSGAGKTYLTESVLNRANEIFTQPVHNILWCFTEYQPSLMKRLKTSIPSIEFHKGLPLDDKLENYDPEQHKIIVLDDLIGECKDKSLQNLFVKSSHHQNISVLFLTQNLFAPGLRTLSLQCKYIILFKNPRDSNHYQYLARQMNGGKCCEAFNLAYSDASKQPHGYVMLDFTQSQDDDLRIRSSIFPDASCTIYARK